MELIKINSVSGEEHIIASPVLNDHLEVMRTMVASTVFVLVGQGWSQIQTEFSSDSSRYWLNLTDENQRLHYIDGQVETITEVVRAFHLFLSGDSRLWTEYSWSCEDPLPQTPPFEAATCFSSTDKGDHPSGVEKVLYELISSHREILARRRSQLIYKDHYGILKMDKWRGEIQYFITNVLTKAIYSQGAASLGSNSFDEIYNLIEADLSTDSAVASVGEEAKDLDPWEYEKYCSGVLTKNGWSTRLTPRTGDQGVDIVASKASVSVALQCKKYSNPVGNAAVQEIIAGMIYEGADFAVVVSNAGFTGAARQLAKVAKVLLIHHDELPRLFELLGAA